METQEIKLQVGVKAILDFQGQILLLKRSDKYKEIVGNWDIPGGRIDSHETLSEALTRELCEETGLMDLTISQSELLSAQDILLNPGVHTVRLPYKIQLAEKPNILIDHESQEFKWFSKEDLVSCETLDQYLKETLIKSGYL